MITLAASKWALPSLASNPAWWQRHCSASIASSRMQMDFNNNQNNNNSNSNNNNRRRRKSYTTRATWSENVNAFWSPTIPHFFPHLRFVHCTSRHMASCDTKCFVFFCKAWFNIYRKHPNKQLSVWPEDVKKITKFKKRSFSRTQIHQNCIWRLASLRPAGENYMALLQAPALD